MQHSPYKRYLQTHSHSLEGPLRQAADNLHSASDRVKNGCQLGVCQSQDWKSTFTNTAASCLANFTPGSPLEARLRQQPVVGQAIKYPPFFSFSWWSLKALSALPQLKRSSARMNSYRLEDDQLSLGSIDTPAHSPGPRSFHSTLSPQGSNPTALLVAACARADRNLRQSVQAPKQARTPRWAQPQKLLLTLVSSLVPTAPRSGLQCSSWKAFAVAALQAAQISWGTTSR